MNACPTQDILDQILPPETTDSFFDALYGAAEEGAYDIRLICRNVSPQRAEFAFQLIGRPGKCLRCNLTHGLPQVFEKHPIIDAPGLASKLAKILGWTGYNSFTLGPTQEQDEFTHFVPFVIFPRA